MGLNQVNLLGINFTLKINEIIESSFDCIIKQIRNLNKIWSFRKLTVLGRVTILKTLIIPKITYLLIKMFFKFIWLNKPENPPKQMRYITQDYKYGGVKMPNIYHVLTSLKSTWMRGYFLNDSKWVNLFNSATGLSTRYFIIHGITSHLSYPQ